MARISIRSNRKKNKSRRRARRANGLAIRTNKRKANRKHNRRKNGLAIRTNGLAIRTNGRKHNRKHNRRKNGLAIRTNGKFARKANRRKNGLAIRTNGLSRRHNGIAQIDGIVQKVPVVGPYLVPVVSPALLGAASLAAVHVALSYAAPMIPESVGKYVEPVAYTLGAATLGLAVAALPIQPSMKAAFAGAAVVAGGAIDAFRYLTSDEGTVGRIPMGDGGAWQLAGDPAPDAPDDADDMACAAQYAQAEPVDAASCGSDLDPVEGEAALAGPRFWASRFPPVRVQTRVIGRGSHHAGQHGHRWGWLIRAIGFKRFRALARLPAAERVAYLQSLKAHAIASLPGSIGTDPAYAGAYAGMMYAA